MKGNKAAIRPPFFFARILRLRHWFARSYGYCVGEVERDSSTVRIGVSLAFQLVHKNQSVLVHLAGSAPEALEGPSACHAQQFVLQQWMLNKQGTIRIRGGVSDFTGRGNRQSHRDCTLKLSLSRHCRIAGNIDVFGSDLRRLLSYQTSQERENPRNGFPVLAPGLSYLTTPSSGELAVA